MVRLTSLDRLIALLGRRGRLGANPAESEEDRLHKTLVVGASLMFILAGLLWGSVYIAFDEPLAGAVPISYALASSLSIDPRRVCERAEGQGGGKRQGRAGDLVPARGLGRGRRRAGPDPIHGAERGRGA